MLWLVRLGTTFPKPCTFLHIGHIPGLANESNISLHNLIQAFLDFLQKHEACSQRNMAYRANANVDLNRSERRMLAFQFAMIDMKLHMLVLACYSS